MAGAGKTIRVALVYPDLLGTYGDSGNAQVLAVRARMHGLRAEILAIGSGDAIGDDADVYVIGGGEDGPQQAAVVAARRDGGLARALQGGAQLVAICAGMQILGQAFATADSPSVEGLGLLPLITRHSNRPRAVGELLVEADPSTGAGLVTGYENHAGQTELLEGRPLGQVLAGVGNRYEESIDGFLSGQVVASYCHGPLLARNPALADLVLGRIPGVVLAPLADEPWVASIGEMRSERIAAARARHRREEVLEAAGGAASAARRWASALRSSGPGSGRRSLL
ncbi:MAG: glutamine amidotransferase [Actinomycetota bacterium]|nr:glutamine amidotransferase [Actinomycetota bacterium]